MKPLNDPAYNRARAGAIQNQAKLAGTVRNGYEFFKKIKNNNKMHLFF